jgi:hypothetical protein
MGSSSDVGSGVIQRLLKYTQTRQIIVSKEARSVFNDLQLILTSSRASCRWHDHWNPFVDEDIVRVRNVMNLAQQLTVDAEYSGMTQYINL